MKNLKYIQFIFLLILSNSVNSNQDSIVFHGAYTFETFDGQRACAVYVSIFNNTNKDFLIESISTKVATKAEIHDVVIENEIIKMKKKENFLIKSKQQVFFQPGGTQNMYRRGVLSTFHFSHFSEICGTLNKKSQLNWYPQKTW